MLLVMSMTNCKRHGKELERLTRLADTDRIPMVQGLEEVCFLLHLPQKACSDDVHLADLLPNFK